MYRKFNLNYNSLLPCTSSDKTVLCLYEYRFRSPVCSYCPTDKLTFHSLVQDESVYYFYHSNEMINGWFETAPEEDTSNAIRYLRLTKKEGYHWGMMQCMGKRI